MTDLEPAGPDGPDRHRRVTETVTRALDVLARIALDAATSPHAPFDLVDAPGAPAGGAAGAALSKALRALSALDASLARERGHVSGAARGLALLARLDGALDGVAVRARAARVHVSLAACREESRTVRPADVVPDLAALEEAVTAVRAALGDALADVAGAVEALVAEGEAARAQLEAARARGDHAALLLAVDEGGTAR